MKKCIFSLLFFALFFNTKSFCQTEELGQKIIDAKIQADSGRYDSTISILYPIIQKAYKDQPLLVKVYMGLAQAHSYEQSFDIGLKYYGLAYETATELGDDLIIGKSLLGMGAVSYMLDSISLAKEYYEKSLPTLAKNKDTFNLANIHSNIGLIQSNDSLYNKADQSFSKAMHYFKQLNNWHGIASTYYNQGFNRSREGKSDEALELFFKCIDLSIEHNLAEDRSKAILMTAEEYSKQGKYKESVDFFIEYHELGHDIFHRYSKERVEELEFKYQTAEFERSNAQKQTRIITLYFTVGFIILAATGGYFFMNQRRRRIKTEALRNQEAATQKIEGLLQDQEMKTAYVLLEGQDKERKRIATELHDNLGSILVTLNMYADSLTGKSKKEEVADIASRISQTSTQANEEVRKISHSLDSGLLKHFGLKAAVKQLMEAVEMSKKIRIELELHLEEHFSNDTGLEIYRIIQELVNNSLKHSNCSVIRLELNQIDREVSLIYEDNGKGFDVNRVSRGMGLNNIEKRAEKLGGDFRADSIPGRGSTFIIEIPEV